MRRRSRFERAAKAAAKAELRLQAGRKRRAAHVPVRGRRSAVLLEVSRQGASRKTTMARILHRRQQPALVWWSGGGSVQ
eukprot:6211841-Pleurochrysis_carterae.AAC.3